MPLPFPAFGLLLLSLLFCSVVAFTGPPKSIPVATKADPGLIEYYNGFNPKAALRMRKETIVINLDAGALAARWEKQNPQAIFYMYHFDSTDETAYAEMVSYVNHIDRWTEIDHDFQQFTLHVHIPWTSIKAHTKFVPGQQPETTVNPAWVPKGGE
ncbi:hypothetical protein M9X92_010674 [Pyricularia oryzae]|nr:hypothetical protein M9X92_010674 [Pyricularia oryzae]